MRVRAGMAAQLLFWAGSNEMQDDKNVLQISCEQISVKNKEDNLRVAP